MKGVFREAHGSRVANPIVWVWVDLGTGLSWRPWQVGGKLVATVQTDAVSPAGAWLVAVAVLPRSFWLGWWELLAEPERFFSSFQI